MISQLRDWNAGRLAADKPAINMGVGVNTDNVVTGNIGSSKRMDFTMIGDGVNLAARLEGSCKTYGAQIIISEFTQSKLKGIYALRELDRIVVKGKTEPVKVYEVLDYHNKESFPNMIEVLEMFNNAMEFYNEAKWDDAIKYFNKAKKANPNPNKAKPRKYFTEAGGLYLLSHHFVNNGAKIIIYKEFNIANQEAGTSVASSLNSLFNIQITIPQIITKLDASEPIIKVHPSTKTNNINLNGIEIIIGDNIIIPIDIKLSLIHI